MRSLPAHPIEAALPTWPAAAPLAPSACARCRLAKWRTRSTPIRTASPWLTTWRFGVMVDSALALRSRVLCFPLRAEDGGRRSGT